MKVKYFFTKKDEKDINKWLDNPHLDIHHIVETPNVDRLGQAVKTDSIRTSIYYTEKK